MATHRSLPFAVAVLAAALVATLGWADGGYFARDWGVLLLAGGLVIAATAILGTGAALDRRQAAWLAALLALAAWQLTSIAWSPGADGPTLDAELTLVYAVLAAAAVVAVRRSAAEALVIGTGAGCLVVTLVGLREHLFPDELSDEGGRLFGPRLAGPMGYANAAAILAAIGLVLAVAIVTHRKGASRVAASAAVVPLGVALYLTFSRGALLALAAGLVVLLAAERRRVETVVTGLVLAAPLCVAVFVTRRHEAVVGTASLDEMRADGRSLALQLLPAVVLAAGVGWARGRIPTVGGVPPRARRPLAAGAAVLAVVAVAAVLVQLGSPGDLVHRAGAAFTAPQGTGRDELGERLFSASGNFRADYWRVARDMVAREPLLGEGAGSFERWWTEERPSESGARNAHNLYLETLAEVGPVGLVLVLAVIGIPLLALPRARDVPLAPAAGAGFAMVALQSAVDWDWEIPLVTIPALWLAAAVLAVASGTGRRRPSPPRRAGRVAAAVAVLAVGLVVHVGNRSAAEADRAIVAGDPTGSARWAEKARGWMPWASRPLLLLGEAETALGDAPAARRSLRRAVLLDPEDWRGWYGLAAVATTAERGVAVRRAWALNPLGSEVSLLRDIAPPASKPSFGEVQPAPAATDAEGEAGS